MDLVKSAAGPIDHRLAGVVFILPPVLLTGFVLRIALAVTVWQDLGGAPALAAAFLVGALQDLICASYLYIPAITTVAG
jgi:hypothetical protein